MGVVFIVKVMNLSLASENGNVNLIFLLNLMIYVNGFFESEKSYFTSYFISYEIQ